MDYLRKFVTGPQGGAAPTGAETVERLCDRVQSSTLLDDRRDAVRALKSLSKKFRLEVGTQAMGVLISVLQVDRGDSEILGYALDTLCNVMSNEPPEEEIELPEGLPEDLGSQFTEMFIKTAENVTLLLSLLEEYDFHVRWPTVRLMTILLTNRSKDLQECILVSPMGVSRLMDLLSDSREVIRNDGLLLLIQLTKGNANIQKIVAFENAFERLLDIIAEEGNSDGGIVVEDCLLLLLNLLKNNSSNQNFFKEGSYIQHLAPFFLLEPADQSPQGGWSAQKVTNIHLMLQLVRTLVSPSNPQEKTTACQRVMNQCGLLKQLCSILMASGVPADVLTETINTVSEVIRGNPGNQEYFASVMAPSNPPRPAIVVLLMSMVNEKQPFVLRCAVLYCFQSFLYKNQLGQSQIVQTLLPSTADVNTISAGQLLCGGLFSADPMSTWFAAVALLHSIVDNCEQKEQLLRVQLATSLGNPPVSLLQQCTNIIAQGAKLQTRVGILLLLCHWLAACPLAVTHFLGNANNVPFLISQVSASEGDEMELLSQGLCAFLLGICVNFNDDEVENNDSQSLRQIIEKRIGLEMYTDKLNQVSKHESYSKAAKRPQLNYKHPNDVVFDYEFTRLFKTLENEVLKSLSPATEDEVEKKKKQQSLAQHESIVEQYKELIREQDLKLNEVKSTLEELRLQHSHAEKEREDMLQQIQQLKDQNALLKAQRGGVGNSQNDLGDFSKLQQDIDGKKKEIEEKDKQIEHLKQELTVAEAKALVIDKDEEDSDTSASKSAMLHASVNRLNSDVEELKKKLDQKEEEIKLYKNKYDETSKQVAELRQQLTTGEDSANAALLAERQLMVTKMTELEARVTTMEKSERTLTEEKSTLQTTVNSLTLEKQSVEDQKLRLSEEADSVRKEQEDLLVLLADQDAKLSTYKKRLKELGQVIEEDDEDDDDDDEDDDLEDGEDDEKTD